MILITLLIFCSFITGVLAGKFLSILNNPKFKRIGSEVFISIYSLYVKWKPKPHNQLQIINSKCAKLNFVYNDQKYELFLPYNRRNALKLNKYKIIIHDDESTINWRFCPVLDIFPKARDLGFNSYEVYNSGSSEQKYCDEIVVSNL